MPSRRARASRRRWPADRKRAGAVGQPGEADARQAPLGQPRAMRPPRRAAAGPEGEILGDRQGRLDRVEMADEVQACGMGLAVGGDRSCPFQDWAVRRLGRIRPAITRSRLDLPEPLGPRSTSA